MWVKRVLRVALLTTASPRHIWTQSVWTLVGKKMRVWTGDPSNVILRLAAITPHLKPISFITSPVADLHVSNLIDESIDGVSRRSSVGLQWSGSKLAVGWSLSQVSSKRLELELYCMMFVELIDLLKYNIQESKHPSFCCAAVLRRD